MSMQHFQRLVAEFGEEVILETTRTRTGVRVAVVERDSLEVTDEFVMDDYPETQGRTAVVVPKWSPARYKSTFHIPESNARNWELSEKNLLLSRPEFSENKLERISWHPLSGEMILSERGQSMHAHDIHNHGSHPFDEYVRVLVLPEKRKVTTRPWFPFGMNETKYLMPEDAKYISHSGQDALRRVLEKAGMPKSWKFEYNVTNPRLEQLTGRMGW